jgi:hypothetical protein
MTTPELPSGKGLRDRNALSEQYWYFGLKMEVHTFDAAGAYVL